MAVSEEYIKLAKEVDIVSVLEYIEHDLNVSFNMLKGTVVNLRCPYEVFDIDSSVHDTSSISKTAINLTANTVKCYNPACSANKPLDTLGLIQLFYSELSFEGRIKLVLGIGGIDYISEAKDISPELKLLLLRTNYVKEKSDNLIKGYELIQEKKEPKGRIESLYVDAAKYLLSRGITVDVARKMKFGVGGGPSKIIKNASPKSLRASKIYNAKDYELMNNRILIPNISRGLVVGITGRAIYDDNLRYLNVGDVKNLINIDRAKKHDRVFFFEGGLNGASYEVLTGESNYVTLQGASSFKREFLQEIINQSVLFNKDTEFVYVADNDIAGLKAATDLGIEILRLGFTLNVLVSPTDKNGNKIDVNDILKHYGPQKGLDIWNKFTERVEPFVVFAIKQEILALNGLNTLTTEIRKTKIIQKYLSLDFIDPNERWVLEQYFLSHGYPVTKDFFNYVDLKFVTKPQLSDNKLICFVGGINEELKECLIENERPFNVLDIDVRCSVYDIDSSVEIILITNSLFLFKTKKIFELLKSRGHSVKIHYSDNPMTSMLEYVFAVSKAIDGDSLFEEFRRNR